MFSISTFPGIGDFYQIAESNDIELETTFLVFIGDYADEKLNDLKTNKGLARFRSAHGPFFDLIPCTSDRELRDLIFRRFKKTIDWCGRLGIYHIIFHSGWFPKTYPDDAWIENSYSFWDQLLDDTPPSMNLYLENVFEEHPFIIRELIDKIGKSNFNACLDIGHVNSNSPETLESWVKDLGTRIGHLHIHNNHGKNDDHFGLVKGSLNFPETFDLFNRYCPDAYWNLEIKTDVDESIELVMNHLGS